MQEEVAVARAAVSSPGILGSSQELLPTGARPPWCHPAAREAHCPPPPVCTQGKADLPLWSLLISRPPVSPEGPRLLLGSCSGSTQKSKNNGTPVGHPTFLSADLKSLCGLPADPDHGNRLPAVFARPFRRAEGGLGGAGGGQRLTGCGCAQLLTGWIGAARSAPALRESCSYKQSLPNSASPF